MNSTGKTADVKLVGVKYAADKIIKLLTRGTNHLQIISIVGMPGLGKTAITNYVYEHQSVSMHFHVRAWYCVSQAYKRETLLVDLLSQVVGVTKISLEEFSGDDLANMLRQKLKGNRYLIVIDDIWDIEVWKDLRQTFPDDGNRSRILFTTRNHYLARKADSVPYNLHLLSDEESCKLLWFKVFGEGTCPNPELLITSRRIAKKCKGLPLSVVLVAGILRKTEIRKESWEKVAERDISLLGKYGKQSDHIRFQNVLELSYYNLPLVLRPCFLYFAAFPKNTSISVSKLIPLWVSQGFVQGHHTSLEEEAESYLYELIDRSLVMIAKRSSNCGVKACRIHDVLQDFCSMKASEEKLPFENTEQSMFGGTVKLHHLSLIYYNVPNRAIAPGAKQASSSTGPVFTGRLHSPTFRSFAWFVPRVDQQRGLDDSFIARHEFLTVLDLGKVLILNSSDTSDIILIAKLINLRFLGIRPQTNEIPAELGNLLMLETLVLTGTIGYVNLPESLWQLKHLRNVLMDHGFFNFQYCSQDFVEKLSQVYDLKSVSTLSLRHGGHVESCFLRRLPNLQKLACRFVYSWDEAKECCIFPALDFLNQLLSLNLLFSGVMRYPCRFSFPSNLKKLSLSNSRLPWDAISVIMRQLPNLEVLKLLNKAFEGRQWDMGDCEMLFPKLKFLKLDSLDIQVWNAENEPLPCLQQLVVLSCSHLEQIPPCFGEISTLQSIEMKWCSSSAINSVKKILQNQRDLSNDDLKVALIGEA